MDRLLLSPAPRETILAGIILSAAVRVCIPVPALLLIAIAVGAPLPSLAGLLIIVTLVPLFAATAATWAAVLALVSARSRPRRYSGLDPQHDPLLASFAPEELLQPWMRTIAQVNPSPSWCTACVRCLWASSPGPPPGMPTPLWAHCCLLL